MYAAYAPGLKAGRCSSSGRLQSYLGGKGGGIQNFIPFQSAIEPSTNYQHAQVPVVLTHEAITQNLAALRTYVPSHLLARTLEAGFCTEAICSQGRVNTPSPCRGNCVTVSLSVLGRKDSGARSHPLTPRIVSRSTRAEIGVALRLGI